jgi:hypothetical protein
MAGCFAFFILLYMVFTKIFPIVSIWEIQEGRERSVAEVKERIESYLPAPAPEPDPAGGGSGTVKEEDLAGALP